MKKPLPVILIFMLATTWLHAGSVVAEALKSIALVQTIDGICTAFSPAPTLWVTKLHCADDDYKFKVRGEDAEFLSEDKNLDLLLLRGPIVPAIKIAKEESELGDPLAMFGWPVHWSDQVPYISYGHVSAVGISRSYQHKQARLNAVDGSIYFGMSGGPAINSKGEVVGVIDGLSVDPPIPIAYITPLKELRKFLGLDAK
jgi:hypothetical protein